MRLLFLDIDGCLNTSPYGECIYNMNTEDIAACYSDLTYLKDRIPVCKLNLDALRQITESVPDIGIIWTTDWRFDCNDDYANKFGWRNPKVWLEAQPWLKSRVIGMTPKKMSSNRFEEIHFWFAENAFGRKYADSAWLMDKMQSPHSMFFNAPYYDVDNYAIIDDFDSSGMSRYGKHFFKCEYSKGLTPEMARDIIKYLQTDDFDENELDWKN